MKNAKKLGVLALLVGLIFVLYQYTPAKHYLSPEGLNDLKSWIAAQGIWAPIVFIGMYIAATVFCLPGSILTLAAGAIFGTALGFIYVVVGSNIGANFAFLIARYLGKDMADKLLRGGKLANFQKGIENNAFFVVLGLRLVPAFPFNALNYGLGLTPLPWKSYALGSLLGMLPGTFAYVALGNVANAAQGFSLTDPEVLKKPEVWGPFALVIALALIPKLLKGKVSLPSKKDS